MDRGPAAYARRPAATRTDDPGTGVW